MCLTGWMGTAATTRTQFYRYKGREYILASRSLGSKDLRLIFKHILPNVKSVAVFDTAYHQTMLPEDYMYACKYEYYKKSLPLINYETKKSLISELYYKFAGMSDERNNTKTAVEYYKKCIELDSNPKTNRFLSRALANLAELFDEAGSSALAIKYYNQSMKIDNITKNYSGLYYSAIHLAEIYSAQDTNKSLDFMMQALSYAKQLNEPFYIAGASLELGDYYMLRRDVDSAYKYFISAYNIAKKSFTKDNLNKIQSRIDDIKHRLNEQDFKKLQEKYGK